MSQASSSLYFSPVHDTLPDRRKTTAESLSANKEDTPESEVRQKGRFAPKLLFKIIFPRRKILFSFRTQNFFSS